jgi:hypothetical protein
VHGRAEPAKRDHDRGGQNHRELGDAAMTAEEQAGLNAFVDLVRGSYGNQLVDVLLFGSRARGDARPDSDYDVAVILRDGDWDFWPEKMRLAGLAYDILLDHGLYIQPWPIQRSALGSPETHSKRRLIEAVRKEGRALSQVT